MDVETLEREYQALCGRVAVNKAELQDLGQRLEACTGRLVTAADADRPGIKAEYATLKSELELLQAEKAELDKRTHAAHHALLQAHWQVAYDASNEFLASTVRPAQTQVNRIQAELRGMGNNARRYDSDRRGFVEQQGRLRVAEAEAQAVLDLAEYDLGLLRNQATEAREGLQAFDAQSTTPHG